MKKILCLMLLYCFTGFGVAIKNYNEIYQSLSTVLNVDKSDFITLQYKAVQNNLPLTGKVSEYTSVMQFGVYVLSAAFCEERVKRDATLTTAERWLFKNADFAKKPGTLTENEVKEYLSELALLFWQREIRNEEAELLLPVVLELSQKTQINMATFLGHLCSIFGISLDFIKI